MIVRLAAALAALLLVGCAGRVAPALTAPLPTTSVGTTTVAMVAGPAVSELRIDPAAASRALRAFRGSCPALLRRDDRSGLTQPGDWQPACLAAATTSDPSVFFADQFATVSVGSGAAFVTGYYEPEIAGCRQPIAGCQTPIYRRPSDLIEVDLGRFSDAFKGKTIRGRVEGGALVPYYDRAAIEAGALGGKGLELAWADDPIELFFLQIQGSGRVRLPDGSVMRIGYDGQNGRDYTAIGALLRGRGLLGPGQATMDGITDWLRVHPTEGHALMAENKSYVFFRELTGDGPNGALDVPVTPRATVAADPAFVPLGAPVWLALDRAEASGLWIAQDTGGAIKGANRFDTFWGAGDDAKRIAGGLSSKGDALILLPKATVARLTATNDVPAAPRP